MRETFKSDFEALAKEQGLYPQEQLMRVAKKKNSLYIGIPKEVSFQENRVPLTPEAVALLINNGHEVCLEAGAGKLARFEDNEYSDAGARIVYSAKEVYECDVVLKVSPPTEEEIGYMKPGGILISALQMSRLDGKYIQLLNAKKITALGYEFLEDEVGGMPIVRAMSEIAGSTVMLIAAEYLSSFRNGKGIILGGITGVPPTKVLILGAGTVGEYAARAALGLGAEVKIFDNLIYKLRRIKQELGHQLFTSTIDTGTLNDALSRADVVIGALRAEEGRAPCVVTEEMLSTMRPGSVVIDVSIDQGGCFETSEVTTHKNPVFIKHDIIHYCVPNIPSRVARTASTALSNIFTPILIKAADLGGIDEMIFSKPWFMKGIYTYKGSLTNAHLAKRLNMKHKDLKLLMAARF
jgi:alanine dehydrogenase